MNWMKKKYKQEYVPTEEESTRAFNKELRLIILFGLRYALPRHTYAFRTVSGYILHHIEEFEDHEIDGMIKDCDFLYPNADFGGDVCDQPAVDRFKVRLADILQKRKEA